jgi:imidazolonepropionase-like amidohydrolase
MPLKNFCRKLALFVVFLLALCWRVCRNPSAGLFDHGLHSQESAPSVIITSVTPIDWTGSPPINGVDVLIQRDRILRIGKGLAPPAGSIVVNGLGKFLIPGLWDMHVHLTGLSADPKWDRDRLLPLLVANGITGVRDMGGDLTALKEWKQQTSSGKLLGPEMVIAGPMLDGESDDPSVLKIGTPDEARDRVKELQADGVDFIKILSGLNRDTYFAVAKESRKRGMTFVGHVPPLVGTGEASDAGQKSLEHILYGGFTIACSSQEEKLRKELATSMQSGAIMAMAKVEDEAAATFDPQKAQSLWKVLAQNGTWVVPTLSSVYVHSQMDRLVTEDPAADYLPRTMSSQWTKDALRRALQPEKLAWYQKELIREIALVRQMHAAGVRILAGTDSLDPHHVVGFSLPKELELLVDSGFTPLEAIEAATIKPAHFLGLPDHGSIREGSVANLVLLDANPLEEIGNVRKIDAVVLRGKLLTKTDLSRLLQDLRLRPPQ